MTMILIVSGAGWVCALFRFRCPFFLYLMVFKLCLVGKVVDVRSCWRGFTSAPWCCCCRQAGARWNEMGGLMSDEREHLIQERRRMNDGAVPRQIGLPCFNDFGCWTGWAPMGWKYTSHAIAAVIALLAELCRRYNLFSPAFLQDFFGFWMQFIESGLDKQS